MSIIGNYYKTLYGKEYVKYVIARVKSDEDNDRYFFEVVHDNKSNSSLGSFKPIWETDYEYINSDQLEEGRRYVNWPIDGMELLYRKIKATKLAKKMYPEAKIDGDYLLVGVI